MSWEVALIVTAPQLIAALAAAWYGRQAHRSVKNDMSPQLTQMALTMEHDVKPGLADVAEQVHQITGET